MTPIVQERSFYNTQGQIVRTVDADGLTTLYEYDALGRLFRTATDGNANGLIDLAHTPAPGVHPDRVTESLQQVGSAQVGSGNVRRTRRFTYADDTDTVLEVGIEESALTTPQNWSRSFGRTSHQITAYNTNTQTRTVTTTHPGNSQTVEVYTDGRLQTRTRKDALGVVISQQTHIYDPHGRLEQSVDARNGATQYLYDAADRISAVISPPHAPGEPAQTNTFFHDPMGRRIGTVLPDGSWTTNLYYQTGHLQLTYGSQTYPVEYTYDAQGRMRTMKTWTDFPGPSGIEALTAWHYHPQRGWLERKAYHDDQGPAYTYTPAGRLLTRTWERGDITTYAYTPHGDLESVTYTAAAPTPNVEYTYNRRGLMDSLTDVLGTRTFTHHDDGQVDAEIMGALVVTRTYDDLRRPQGVTFTLSGSPVHSYGYAYDDASRLETVTFAGHSAHYTYHPDSSLLDGLSLRRNGAEVLHTHRAFDFLQRLTAITATATPGGVVDQHIYVYNELNQRTRVDRSDGAWWDYAYDDLGQVTNAVRHWLDGHNTPIAGQQFAYAYDDIGNRRTATANTQTTHYTPDALNRYIAIENPGAVDLIGRAAPEATVTVNTNPVVRQADYFHYQALEDNLSGALFADYTLTGVVNHPTTDVVSVENRQVYVPAREVEPLYDDDGNLINDGRWTYTWDGENRLVEMEAVAEGRRLAFDYDGLSRRVRKRVYLNEVLESDVRYVYDGWNMIAELDASDLSPIRTFVWGLDLSGSLQGAGGVGGLLAILDASDVYAPTYDVNGNVTRLVDTQDGSVSAIYEYDPFGNILRQTGPAASDNPFRFSTKYHDDETGLVYYGYRMYSPQLGRFLNRDPIEEDGGHNLYGFVGNNPVSSFDLLGLSPDEVLVVVYLHQVSPGAEPDTRWTDLLLGTIHHKLKWVIEDERFPSDREPGKQKDEDYFEECWKHVYLVKATLGNSASFLIGNAAAGKFRVRINAAVTKQKFLTKQLGGEFDSRFDNYTADQAYWGLSGFILTHEILHSVGVSGHGYSDRPNTVMHSHTPPVTWLIDPPFISQQAADKAVQELDVE